MKLLDRSELTASFNVYCSSFDSRVRALPLPLELRLLCLLHDHVIIPPSHVIDAAGRLPVYLPDNLDDLLQAGAIMTSVYSDQTGVEAFFFEKQAARERDGKLRLPACLESQTLTALRRFTHAFRRDVRGQSGLFREYLAGALYDEESPLQYYLRLRGGRVALLNLQRGMEKILPDERRAVPRSAFMRAARRVLLPGGTERTVHSYFDYLYYRAGAVGNAASLTPGALQGMRFPRFSPPSEFDVRGASDPGLLLAVLETLGLTRQHLMSLTPDELLRLRRAAGFREFLLAYRRTVREVESLDGTEVRDVLMALFQGDQARINEWLGWGGVVVGALIGLLLDAVGAPTWLSITTGILVSAPTIYPTKFRPLSWVLSRVEHSTSVFGRLLLHLQTLRDSRPRRN